MARIGGDGLEDHSARLEACPRSPDGGKGRWAVLKVGCKAWVLSWRHRAWASHVCCQYSGTLNEQVVGSNIPAASMKAQRVN